MPVLVTGATGHLGANLVRRLLETGCSVRALVRPGSDTAALAGLDVESVVGDVRDASAMRHAVAGVDVVHHCAAKVSTVAGGEREIFECNVVGTRNVLDAARSEGVGRVVVTGSFSAVGETDGPSDERAPFSPFDVSLPYEWTKALVELEAWRAAAAGLGVVVATSCAILGPHDYKPSRMGRTLADFANGRMRAYITGGFEFVAVRDICDGHLRCAETGRAGEKYIFGTQYLTVDELMGIFEDVTGMQRPPRLPAPLVAAVASVTSPLLTALAPGVPQRLTPAAVRILQRRRRADTTKARAELGFEPTSVRQAIHEAYDDFRRRGTIEPPRKRVISSAQAPHAIADRAASAAIPSVGRGVPWIGYGLALGRDPVGFLLGGWRRHGPVFSFPLMGRRVVAFLGPRAHEVFFRCDDETLGSARAREAYRFNVPVFGKGVAYDVQPEGMREQLGFVLPALRDDRLQAYVGAMQDEAESYFAGWAAEGEVDLHDSMNELTTLVAARCLLGSRFRERSAGQHARLDEDLKQHFTAGHVTWAIVLLLLHREWLAPVLEEQRRVAGGKLTLDAVRRMSVLEQTLMEAERLQPAVAVIMRRVLREFEFDGFTARPGDLAMVSPAAAHRLPTVFRDPERYDPGRFAPPREEHKKAPHALIAFSGGGHRCVGFSFAYLEMKIIVSVLLRSFELRLGRGSWEPDYASPVTGPVRPAKIRYVRVSTRLDGPFAAHGPAARASATP